MSFMLKENIVLVRSCMSPTSQRHMEDSIGLTRYLLEETENYKKNWNHYVVDSGNENQRQRGFFKQEPISR